MKAPIPAEEFLVLLLVNYFREVKNTEGHHTGQVTPSASDATQLVLNLIDLSLVELVTLQTFNF